MSYHRTDATKPQRWLHVLPDGIPQALKQIPRWVVWWAKWDGKRWKKVPHLAQPYHPAQMHIPTPVDVTDPATWNTFEAALACYQSLGYDGIGFGLGYDEQHRWWWSGIDGDHIITAGEKVLVPATERMLRDLDTYMEVSASGTGLHALMLGLTRVAECKSANHKIEIDSEKRYFAVTGHHWPGSPTTVEDRSQQLATLTSGR
jgi:putative DNA primase/helicase